MTKKAPGCEQEEQGFGCLLKHSVILIALSQQNKVVISKPKYEQ